MKRVLVVARKVALQKTKVCKMPSPCSPHKRVKVGPRNGHYHETKSGYRRYCSPGKKPRPCSPHKRVKVGPRNGHYHETKSGYRRYCSPVKGMSSPINKSQKSTKKAQRSTEKHVSPPKKAQRVTKSPTAKANNRSKSINSQTQPHHYILSGVVHWACYEAPDSKKRIYIFGESHNKATFDSVKETCTKTRVHSKSETVSLLDFYYDVWEYAKKDKKIDFFLEDTGLGGMSDEDTGTLNTLRKLFENHYGRDAEFMINPNLRIHWVDARLRLLDETAKTLIGLPDGDSNEVEEAMRDFGSVHFLKREMDYITHELSDTLRNELTHLSKKGRARVNDEFVGPVTRRLREIKKGIEQRHTRKKFDEMYLDKARSKLTTTHQKMVLKWRDRAHSELEGKLIVDIESLIKCIAAIPDTFQDDLEAFENGTRQVMKLQFSISHNLLALESHYMDEYTICRILKSYVNNVMLHVGVAHAKNVGKFFETEMKYKKIGGKDSDDGEPCTEFSINPASMF